MFAEAVFARSISADKELRSAMARSPEPHIFQAIDDVTGCARAALHASMFAMYTQAAAQLSVADRAFEWNLDIAAVFHSWQGATIRSLPLRRLHNLGDASVVGILKSHLVRDYVADGEVLWRRFLAAAVQSGTPVPCHASAFNFIDSLTATRSTGAIVQSLRSRLGGSTYKRIDRPGLYTLDGDGTGVDSSEEHRPGP
jgi:6-phosphogluconate dehydrogenase